MKEAIIWGVLAVVFAALEIATVQLVSIWFTIGAAAAFISCFLDANITVQLIVFVAVSGIALVCTRPFVKKFSTSKIQATNADMCIGKEAVVTKAINNKLGEGSAKVGGIEWTARNIGDGIIPEGETVVVRSIEGVKLIVEKQ